ncbi:MAG TPA: hypothetical protein VFH43_09965 [Candidatus Kapabacteria bacterium]|nr:hypothetical protein [Candidatus Kapabacteria bacterium]
MKVRLLDICHARSGDKGDAANVGLIARQEHFYPVIRQFVTKAAVKRHFKGICYGPVDRYELPNLWALNFLLHNTLGGGGTVSLKHDAQGKTLAAALLRMEIDVPAAQLKAKAVKAPAKKATTRSHGATLKTAKKKGTAAKASKR